MDTTPDLAGAGAVQVSADGAANGYLALHNKLNVLQKAAGALAQEAELIADNMRDYAGIAVQLADLSVQAEVDPGHVAEISDISEAYHQAVGGATLLMAAADDMKAAAAHVKTAHRTENSGMHEASLSSPARQAKPGFYQLP